MAQQLKFLKRYGFIVAVKFGSMFYLFIYIIKPFLNLS